MAGFYTLVEGARLNSQGATKIILFAARGSISANGSL
jgi:hypothetical protein